MIKPYPSLFGPLCRSAHCDEEDGLGYIHVLQRGVLQVRTAAQPSLLLDEPSLFLYMNPSSHRLVPRDEHVEMVCASFDFGAGSLEDLAVTAGMSRARFATKFRDMVGMTPVAYLSEWRLGLAQSLLRKGKSVQLVADVVGYGSASALSRAFRAHTGQTPTEWVKNYASRS